MKHYREEKMRKASWKRTKATIDMESGDSYQVGRVWKLDTRNVTFSEESNLVVSRWSTQRMNHVARTLHNYPKWLTGSGLFSIQHHCLGMKRERRKETWKHRLKEGNETGEKQEDLWKRCEPTPFSFVLFSTHVKSIYEAARMSSGQGKRGLCVAHLHLNRCWRPPKSLPWYWTFKWSLTVTWRGLWAAIRVSSHHELWVWSLIFH